MAGCLTRKYDLGKTHDTQWETNRGFGQEMGGDLLTVSPHLESNLNSHGKASAPSRRNLSISEHAK